MKQALKSTLAMFLAVVIVALNTNVLVFADELGSESSTGETTGETENTEEGEALPGEETTETGNENGADPFEHERESEESGAEEPEEKTIPPEAYEEETGQSVFTAGWDGVYNLATGEIEPIAVPFAPAQLTAQWHPSYKYPKDYFIQGSFYILGDWSRWYLDGQLAYCLEPLNLKSTTGTEYDEIQYEAISKIQQRAIARAMLYGDDGSDIRLHIATQVLIWEIALGQVDPVTLAHKGIGGTRYSAYYLVPYYGLESEYNGLISAIQNHYKLPSFMTGQIDDLDYSPYPYKVPTDGTYLELEDTNGVLADFDIVDGNGYTFTKVGNKLQITATPAATDPYEPTITSTTLVGQYAPSVIAYRAPGPEQVKGISVKDPAKAFMKLSITAGALPAPTPGEVEITLRKADPEHFHPQDYNTAQVTFETVDIDTGFNNLAGVGVRVTGTGSGTGDYVLPCTITLGEGTFEITEIMAPQGYIINKDFKATVTVTVPPKADPSDPDPAPVVNITVHNGTLKGNYGGLYGSSGSEIVLLDNRQKGSLTITKIDFENNYINHNDEHIAQGDATFSGAVFGLYAAEDIILPTSGIKIYSQDDLVATAVTDADGKFTIPEIDNGKYYLQELVPSTGYVFKNEDLRGHIYIVDNSYNPMSGGIVDPPANNVLELDKPTNDPAYTGTVNEYENTVIKGDITIRKFLEDGTISNENDPASANKVKAEGIYFGVYLNTKAAAGNNKYYKTDSELPNDGKTDWAYTENFTEFDLINANYYSPLPDEYFRRKPLDPNNPPPLVNPSTLPGQNETTDPTQAPKKDLYMVLRTNKDGYASTLMPSTIAWSIARAAGGTYGNQMTDGGASLGFPQQGSSAIPPVFNGTEKGGKVNNMQLPYGSYTVVELNPPEGYKPIIFEVFIGRNPNNPNAEETKPNKGEDYPYNAGYNNYEYSYTFEDKVSKQKITVVKTDKETGKQVPQAGITYKIWSWDNATNNNTTGGAASEHPIRPYHKNDNGTVSILVPPNVILNYSELKIKPNFTNAPPLVALDYTTPASKLLANGQPQISWTAAEQAFINADFANLPITIADTTIADIDGSGNIIGIADGTTTFEIALPAGMEPFTGTITVDSTLSASSTTAPKIYTCDGHWITQTITYPTPQTISEYKTDSTGSFTLQDPLVYGDYLLYELLAPHGYFISYEPFLFTVAKSNIAQPNLVLQLKINQTNVTQKGIISIKKMGDVLTGAQSYNSYGYTALKPVWQRLVINSDAVKFEVYAAEDIITPEGTKWYSAGELIQTITTTGGEVKSKELPLGRYRVREIQAPNGYILNTAYHDVELTYQGQTIDVFPVLQHVENVRQNVRFKINKQFQTSSGAIVPANEVYFGLYADEDIYNSNVVLPSYPYSVRLQRSNIVVPVGATIPLEITITPSRANQSYTVSGYDPAIISYNQAAGTLTGLAVGSTAITITTPSGLTVSGTVEVAVGSPTVPAAVPAVDTDPAYPVNLAAVLVLPKDSLIEVIRVTNGEGYSTLELPTAKYYLKELKAPNDYLLDNGKYDIEFTNNAGGSAVVTIPANGGNAIVNYPTTPPPPTPPGGGTPPEPPTPPQPRIGELILIYNPLEPMDEKSNPRMGDIFMPQSAFSLFIVSRRKEDTDED